MDLGLKDKIVLITGSAKGIGKEVAKAFAAEGAILVLNDILQEVLDETVKEFNDAGTKTYGYAFDITNEEAVIDAVAKIEEEVGPIAVLINNAGLQRRFPLEEFPVAEFKRVVDVDLIGSFIVSKSVAKYMIPRHAGRIVNITSLNAELVRKDISPYCAAKGGLKQLTKSMAEEWGKYGISANAVGPGYIKTDINKALWSKEDFDQWVCDETCLKEWGKVEHIANTVVWLASEKAYYITGQSVYVDGGWQAHLGGDPTKEALQG